MKLLITKHGGYENPRRGISLAQGETAELSDDLAAKLLNHGYAVPAPKPEPKIEAVAPAENTAKRVGKPAPSKAPAKEEVAAKDRKKATE